MSTKTAAYYYPPDPGSLILVDEIKAAIFLINKSIRPFVNKQFITHHE